MVMLAEMALARSRLTAQGQISVPAEVRRRLGLGPGSVLEWDEEDGKVVVRRVGRYTSEEMHKALFPNGPPAPRTVEEMDEGIREYMRKKHARR
jgi:antitoxin PrlF